MTGRLEARPISIRKANEFVNQFHRHNDKVDGGLFAVSAWRDGRLVGVGIAGRPIARMKQDGLTFEIRRVAVQHEPHCTSGPRSPCCCPSNGANSFIKARLKRAAAVLGYRRVIEYTLATESGASLRAAGFRLAGRVKGKEWDRPGRPRRSQKVYSQDKLRWEAEISA